MTLVKNTTEPLQLLDIYAENGIAEAQVRVDALATISAGRKGKGDRGLPERSMDGTIYLHDQGRRAPGLEAILKESPKNLTIALPFDELTRCIQQRFTRYTASRLEVYGDARELIEIVEVKKGDFERRVHKVGSEPFKALLETCKVSTSVYFTMARWIGDKGESEVYMPDGLGLYRLKFTSRNSLRGLAGNLELVKSFTGGSVAGVPLDLQIIYIEVADGTSQKRTIPVWTLRMNPPFELSARTMRPALQAAIDSANNLHLPAPAQEDLGSAVLDADFALINEDEPSERDLKQLRTGIRFETLTANFFALVKGSPLEDADEREAWLLSITKGQENSLREIFENAEEPEVTAAWIMEQAQVELRRIERFESYKKNMAEESVKDMDPSNYNDIETKAVEFLAKQLAFLEEHAVSYNRRWEFLTWASGRPTQSPIKGRRDVTGDDIKALQGLLFTDDRKRIPEEQLAQLLGGFDEWSRSDDSAQGVLG